MDIIRAFAPASIGNLGPGFDVLGLAIQGFGDIVEAKRTGGRGVGISKITGFADHLSREVEKNTAGIAAQRTLQVAGMEEGIDLLLHKQIPPGSGLGSSAASAVAAAFAVNQLLGSPLDTDQLIHAATDAEAAVSGGFFADNTATSMLGGATLTRSSDPLEVIALGTIPRAVIVLVRPHLKILTRRARAILPQKVPMRGFVSNMANSCAIVAAFYRQDLDLLARAIEDRVIEPVRAKLIPGFYEVKEAALKEGAKGFSLSGAGPTVFSITDDAEKANAIGEAMGKAFRKKGIESDQFITGIDSQGARLLP
ncbi:MAG: homoserine kinase [candidate division NC10 bacterium]|nr:homoserine kinase [candidate division NC10 bacterium]